MTVEFWNWEKKNVIIQKKICHKLIFHFSLQNKMFSAGAPFDTKYSKPIFKQMLSPCMAECIACPVLGDRTGKGGYHINPAHAGRGYLPPRLHAKPLESQIPDWLCPMHYHRAESHISNVCSMGLCCSSAKKCIAMATMCHMVPYMLHFKEPVHSICNET